MIGFAITTALTLAAAAIVDHLATLTTKKFLPPLPTCERSDTTTHAARRAAKPQRIDPCRRQPAPTFIRP